MLWDGFISFIERFFKQHLLNIKKRYPLIGDDLYTIIKLLKCEYLSFQWYEIF